MPITIDNIEIPDDIFDLLVKGYVISQAEEGELGYKTEEFNNPKLGAILDALDIEVGQHPALYDYLEALIRVQTKDTVSSLADIEQSTLRSIEIEASDRGKDLLNDLIAQTSIPSPDTTLSESAKETDQNTSPDLPSGIA